MQMFGLFGLLWVFDGGVGYRFGVGEELSPCEAKPARTTRGPYPPCTWGGRSGRQPGPACQGAAVAGEKRDEQQRREKGK
jgi:hypothetical protein